MTETDSVLVERDGPVTIVSIHRPHCRNAFDGICVRGGLEVIASGGALSGAARFASDVGRHGAVGRNGG
jgi:hypothetical protein